MRDCIAPGLSPNPFMTRIIPGLLILREQLTFEAWRKKTKATLNHAVSGLCSALSVISESNSVDLFLKSVADRETEGSVRISSAVHVVSDACLTSSICGMLCCSCLCFPYATSPFSTRSAGRVQSAMSHPGTTGVRNYGLYPRYEPDPGFCPACVQNGTEKHTFVLFCPGAGVKTTVCWVLLGTGPKGWSPSWEQTRFRGAPALLRSQQRGARQGHPCLPWGDSVDPACWWCSHAQLVVGAQNNCANWDHASQSVG